MKTFSIAIADLSFDPSNARLHNEKNVEAIKGSLRKFGQQKPIVVDKNNIVIAGNGTLQAAKEMGWDKISAVRTNLEGAEAIAFALADNRTAELAEWDDDILGKQLHGLFEDGWDLGEFGFSEGDWGGDDSEAGGLNKEQIEEIEGDVLLSDELRIDDEYILLVFRDKDKLSKFREKFKIDERCGYWLSRHKKNAEFFNQGPNRVINGEEILNHD